jgi:uncharacterized protein involved in exopolysaccharide biosynthesis
MDVISQATASEDPAATAIAPLLDLVEELRPAPAARHHRRGRSFGLASIAFVIAVSLAGGVLPALMAGPAQYVAAARLQLQPGSTSLPGYLDVVSQRLVSPHLLSQVVAKLKLDRDPEFTGDAAGPLGVAVDLVSGHGAASDANPDCCCCR